MAGRNTAAALLLILQIWESFINDKYMKEACLHDKLACPTCNSPRTCNNHFCLQCKTGGLCPVVFRGDNEHRSHPWLQVRHYSRQDSVLAKDLAHFISKEGLKHIQKNKLNDGQRHCYLRSKKVAEASSSSSTRARAGEKSCRGCMASIRGSKDSKEKFLVCSLQCLVKVARKRPALDLLEMKDGVMEQMKPPLLYTEKLLRKPRMLEAPTKKPIDEALPLPQATGDSPMSETPEAPTEKPVIEALPLPQATGDSPMSETHEAPTEKPVVEALPLPQATGDFPMSETHEGLSVASILEALPFPLVTENYPMFGTPVETSIGEALPFPLPTEDFSMFEKPTAPAETPKLETFSLPLKFQALDFNPEWEAEVGLDWI